jgi:hypothetical protein
MSRPGIEPGLPAWEASTLEKSHIDSLSAAHSEPLLGRHLLTTYGPLHGRPSAYAKHIDLNWEVGRIALASVAP